MVKKDVVIVGARCAGSALATSLSRGGADVLMIDRATFPSDTLSTHIIFPNTIARLEQLGVLDRLLGDHDVPMLAFKMIGFGHEVSGNFTPVDGFDSVFTPRRIALDAAMVRTAIDAGAEVRFGEKLVDVIGAGTDEDPVSGIVLDGGEQVRAKVVLGADGRASKIAAKLGIEKTRENRGDVAFLFAYWRGVPNDGYASSVISENEMISRWANEDGITLLVGWGNAEFTRGSYDERLERYLDLLRRHPEIVGPDLLDHAEMVTALISAPESLMRGYFRKPTGPGWALVGDSCHFKHPATGQGIGDAIEQALYVAEGISGTDPQLDGYEQWRDNRASEHYDWSYSWGRFPRPETEALFRGWAGEPEARQDLLDSFSRQVEPSRVLTPERLGRWFG